MTIAISQFTTKPWTFEDDLRHYPQAGVECIELCEDKLSLGAAAAAAQLEQLREVLRPVSVQARVHSLFPDRMAAEPADPRERVRLFKASMERISKAFDGLPLVFVLISGVPPGHDLRAGWETAMALCPDIARFAAGLGVRVAFEPLGPEGMYTDSFIHGLDQGLRIVDHVGQENFGLLADVWHLWQEHRLLERLESCAKTVFGVHLCDWPQQPPRGLDDRLVPGDGVIDLRAIAGALASGGYAGTWIVEVLSKQDYPGSPWREEPEALLRRCIGQTQSLLQSL